MKAYHPLCNDRGAVLVLMAILLLVLVGMAAISLDVGQLYIARQRAQNVCDAAALAGIRYLDPGKSAETQPTAAQNAVDIAIANNEVTSWLVFEPGTDTQGVAVTFPAENSLRCEGEVKVTYLFAGALGFNDRPVRASAVARLETASSVAYPFIPLAITDTIVNDLSFGETQALKTDKWQEGADAFIGAGNFAPLCFEGDSGGSDYANRLSGDLTVPVELNVGDFVDTKPGNMVGPTYKAATERIRDDRVYTNDATAWNLWSQTWDTASMTFGDTPRLVIMPIIRDPGGTINGRSEPVEVVGYAGFFIESASHTKTKVDGVKTEYVQITGRFVTAAMGADATTWLWWMGETGASNIVVNARLVE